MKKINYSNQQSFFGKRNVIALTAVIFYSFFITNINAQLIVYEPFSYEYASSAPDPDGGINANYGFPFTNSSDNTKTGKGLRVHWGADMTVIDGLTYGNSKGDSLLVKDNALNSNANGTSGVGITLVTLYRNMEDDPYFAYRSQLNEFHFGWNPATGKKEVYLSLLAKVDTVNTIDATVNNTAKRTGIILKVGHNNTENTAGIGQYNSKWYYYHQGGYGFVLADAVAGKTEFFVVKYTFGGLEEFKIDVWMNPELGKPLPATPTSTLTIPTPGQFIGFQGRYGAGNFTFDEIRLGVSAADVMPLKPAPNTVAEIKSSAISNVYQSGTNQITVTLNTKSIQNSGTLEVFDAKGARVFKTNQLFEINNIQTASKGLFVVKITSGAYAQAQKVILK